MPGLDELFQGQELIDETTLPDAEPAQVEAQEPEAQAPESEAPAQREPQHVPLTALQEERQRRQEMKAELEQERQHRARMEERFQQMMERINQPPQPQEEQLVPFEEDPARHVQQLTQRYEQQLNQLRSGHEQQQQQAYQQQQAQQLFNAARAAEDEFRATAPDYNELTTAFTERELSRYKAFGFGEQQARDMVSKDFMALTTYAIQNGKNPAELLYNAARQMVTPGQQQQAPAQAATRAPNGQFTQKQAPATLATATGSAKAPDESGELSLEKVAAMDDASFDKFWKQMERGSVVMPKI